MEKSGSAAPGALMESNTPSLALATSPCPTPSTPFPASITPVCPDPTIPSSAPTTLSSVPTMSTLADPTQACSDSPASIQCPDCLKKFSIISNLNRHRRIHCGVAVEKEACIDCGQLLETRRKDNMANHLKGPCQRRQKGNQSSWQKRQKFLPGLASRVSTRVEIPDSSDQTCGPDLSRPIGQMVESLTGLMPEVGRARITQPIPAQLQVNHHFVS